jgi:hypothetical protein
MTQAEIKEILSKQINQLEMLISAAKQRGDMQTVIQLSTELTEAKDAFNAIT